LALTLGSAAVLAVTVPAAVFHLQGIGKDVRHTAAGQLAQQEFRLSSDQAAALAYLDRAPRPGSVLAPWLLSLSVPGVTGRHVYAGHTQWQPASHVALDSVFFTTGPQAPSGATRRSILLASGATFVVADCDAPPELRTEIAPLARPVRAFGCVTVYERRR
jgi:hypothetical protein